MVPDSALTPPEPLRTELAAFAEAHRLATRAAALDALPEFPWSEFRAMGEQRWLGLHLPPDLGGRGLSLVTTGQLLHHLAWLSGTTFAKLSLQPEFSSVLAEHGSPEQVEQTFRPLMAGSVLVANQVTEPDAGSDARAMRTRAERAVQGYVLTGTKSQAAFAQDAQQAIVYARTDEGSGPAGITAFLVPQTSTGIVRTRIPDLGERWMGRGSIQYERVPVAPGAVIGREGHGFEYLLPELSRERALLAAIYAGVGRFAWERTVEHAQQRVAFGKPLATRQGVSFPLTEDWGRLDATDLYVRETLRRLDAGEPSEAHAALAKWMATDVALTCLDHAIQFHGGRGYSSELPFERMWRDVRSGAIAHGPSEIMHVVAGRALWARESKRPSLT